MSDLPAGREEWKFSVGITPWIEGRHEIAPRWELTGTVRKLLNLSESLVEFDDPLVAGQRFPSRTVHIRSELALKSFEVDGGSGIASLDLTKKSDTSYVLRIQPKRDLPVGAFRFDVRLAAHLLSGKELAFRPMAVTGRVAHDVDVTPQNVFFGGAKIGQTTESRVLLKSLVGKSFTVKSVESDSKDIEARLGSGGHDSKMLLIKQDCTTGGPHTGHVMVSIEESGRSPFTISIPVSYHGFPGRDND